MDRELIERLAREAGAREENVGQGGGYQQLTLSAWLEPDQPDIHLAAFKRFAVLIADELAKEAERILGGKHGWSFVSDGKVYATEQEFIAAGVAAAIRERFKP